MTTNVIQTGIATAKAPPLEELKKRILDRLAAKEQEKKDAETHNRSPDDSKVGNVSSMPQADKVVEAKGIKSKI